MLGIGVGPADDALGTTSASGDNGDSQIRRGASEPKRKARRASVSMVDMEGNPIDVEVAGTGSDTKGDSGEHGDLQTGTWSSSSRRCAWWWPAAVMSKGEVTESMMACAGLIDAAMAGR